MARNMSRRRTETQTLTERVERIEKHTEIVDKASSSIEFISQTTLRSILSIKSGSRAREFTSKNDRYRRGNENP